MVWCPRTQEAEIKIPIFSPRVNDHGVAAGQLPKHLRPFSTSSKSQHLSILLPHVHDDMTAKGPLGSRLLDSGLPSMSKDENKSKSTLELLDNTPSAIQDTYICRRQKLAADAQAVRHASKDFSEA